MRIVRSSRFDNEVGERYEGLPLSSTIHGPPNGHFDRYERKVEIQAGGSPDSAFDATRERLMSYDVFPPSMLRAAICPNGTLTPGSTIVQRARLGPVWLESAVRVVDVWNTVTTDGRSSGFAYVTLIGHPERGVATFAVEMRHSEVWVVLTARSESGTAITRLGRPISRLAQQALTRRAVYRLSRVSAQ